MSWQPIETAPKDGTYFIAYAHTKIPLIPYVICAFYDGNFRRHVTHQVQSTLTHWMPLPEPPK